MKMSTEQIKEIYFRKTQGSKKLFEEAVKTLPGGVAASIKYFDPYPIFMEKGEGPWLFDTDGNRYADYLQSYGPMILGHGHPAVKKAIAEQLDEHGTVLYGTPHRLETEFARRLQGYLPSLEMIRYTNSGTEATLFSLRLAYAFTKKYKIAKFEGHYHGGFNQVLLSVNPKIDEAGGISAPVSLPESAGLEPFQKENTIVLPFNDLDACAVLLKKHKDELAALILEPYQAGYIAAEKDFVEGLRTLTRELGILLIFDEVKTGFRVALGGAQNVYGVKPDLSAFGKVLGAGFPMGIVGGRKDILMQTAPLMGTDIFDLDQSGHSRSSDIVFHSGTYNGHPLILRAGLAVMDVLDNELEPTIKRTIYLMEEISKLTKEKTSRNIVTMSAGTMFNYAICDLPAIRNYRDMQKADASLRKKIDLSLLTLGVYNKPGNRYCMSTVHGDDVIAFTLNAYNDALNMSV
jgi:glutamate-1-semialdehyde 2,1-aminomutase